MIGGGSAESDYIRFSNFNFNIPTGATIQGITVEIDRYATQNTEDSILDDVIRLRKTSGQVGTNKATATWWDTIDNDAYDSYGGSLDLWGTTWSVAEINNADFGVDIAVKNIGSTNTAYVDHVRVIIYYGSSGEVWQNPSNVGSQDDIDGYVSFSTSTEDTSDWLRLTNFGFNIPTTTIIGIEVEIDREATQISSIKDGKIFLRKSSGQVGTDKSAIGYLDTIDDDSYDSYGGNSDLWGTTWTSAEINSPDFGIDI